MRRELLVNVTPPETRVALTEEGRLVEVFHERRGHRGLVGNVYLGRVHRVLPGMQAAFVSIGLDRDAFLYVEDALPPSVEEDGDEIPAPGQAAGRPADNRPRIDDLVKEGQELIVQVTKDPLAGKGPRVTAGISLPGRTLVYLPSAREIGISRRIADEQERERLRKLLEELPGSGGLIARTAAEGAGAAELAADRRYLMDLSDRITRQAERATAPALLHRELDLALRVVRDLVSVDFAAIRVDDEATFARLKEFLTAVAPAVAPTVELSPSEPPLFEAFKIEEEIAKGLERHVELPSGGSIVIQQTEALVAIDVNTGKFVGKDGLEDTVYAANLEAAPEIARQIRLRDLGGLLVIDFIDMADPEHRRDVFEKFEAELAKDRARTRMLPLSEFGLVEVTRQRSRGNLEKTLTRPCPECSGRGRVRTDRTLALDLRRDLLRPPVLYGSRDTIRVRVTPSLARLLAEEDGTILQDVQNRLGVNVEILQDETLSPEVYEVLPR